MLLSVEQALNFTKGVLALHANNKYVSYEVNVLVKGSEQDPKPEIHLTARWKIGEKEKEQEIKGQEFITASKIQRIPDLPSLMTEIVDTMEMCLVQIKDHHCNMFQKIISAPAKLTDE